MNKIELLTMLEELSRDADLHRAHIVADAAILMYINDQDISDAYANVERWPGYEDV